MKNINYKLINNSKNDAAEISTTKNENNKDN